MALTRGVVVYAGTTDPIVTGSDLPIALVGIASNATVANNVITKVTSAADATAKFGAHAAGDTIPRNLDILLRYGCNNIYVIKVADAASIAGSDLAGNRTGIYLVKDIPSLFNVYPAFILAPGQNSDAVVTAAVNAAETIRSCAVIDPTDGNAVSAVVTARSSNAGIGQDKERLIITYPYMTNADTPATHEPLSTHLAGTVAKNGSYGKTVSSLPLLGVGAPAITMSMSVTDPDSDVGKLNGAGVVSIMNDDKVEGGYETWGDRNTLFPSDSGVRSFVNNIRAEDAVMQQAVSRARKFIDMPSTNVTAQLAVASYNAMFYDMITQANLKSGYSIWDEANSDLAAGKLRHLLRFQTNNSVQIMEVGIVIGA